MSANDDLLVEGRGSIAVVTINRPEKGNALTASLLESLADAVRGLTGDTEARCVVLRGAGERFSVGMDLDAMAANTAEENQRLIGAGGPLRGAIQAVEEFPYPIVAMIRGHAAGAACELAIACDLRVGCAGSRMGMPPARLGIVYPHQGLERFVRNLGLPATRKLFYTARYFGGEELYGMGVLDFLCGDGELEDFTMELALNLAGNAPLSMKGHKRILRLIARAEPLSEGAVLEINELVAEALSGTAAIEGIVAFKEKRPPEFK